MNKDNPHWELFKDLNDRLTRLERFFERLEALNKKWEEEDREERAREASFANLKHP